MPILHLPKTAAPLELSQTPSAEPVDLNTRARRGPARHGAAGDLLMHTAVDIPPNPAARDVDAGRLQVDAAAQAARAEAGRDLLGALWWRRVVDGAVAAGRVAVAACLDAARVDAWCAIWLGMVGAAVVDVEDVEGVDVAGDVPDADGLVLRVGGCLVDSEGGREGEV